MIGFRGRIFSCLSRVLPIKLALKIRYYHWNKKWPNLDDPKRLTEKLMWLTRYNELYNKQLIQTIYDKNTVREYVKDKGFEKILVKQYGCFTSPYEIDFSLLPSDYILKLTQSSGQNIIVTRNSKLDNDAIVDTLSKWQNKDKTLDRFTGYYFTKNESIVCEELLRDEDGNIPNDIRICCCNGEAKWIYCDIDTTDNEMKHKNEYYREYFDLKWNFLPVDNVGRVRKKDDEATIKKPYNLEEIIQIAEALSKDFVFVRVDLYNINGKIYFGELTPIPGLAGGFNPDKWDYTFGEMLELPDVNIW